MIELIILGETQMRFSVQGLIYNTLQVWSSLLLYKKILDAIEDNGYDNLTRRACVGKTEKLLMLPLAYTRAFPAPTLF